jgi:hypothetical protein
MHEAADSRRLHPRLRVVRNGDRSVNAVRSDGTSTVACTLSTLAEAEGVAPSPVLAASSPADLAALRGTVGAPKKRLPKRPRIEGQPGADDAYVNVLIELHQERANVSPDEYASALRGLSAMLSDAASRAGQGHVRGAVVRRRNFVAATVPVSMLDTVSRDPAVAFVHPADPLKLDAPPVSPAPGAVKKAVGDPSTHGRGKGVLIGIVDVGGFDFAHPDFLDAQGATRFVAIWDQGGAARLPPTTRGFDYGAEFTKTHMDAAITAAAARGVPSCHPPRTPVADVHEFTRDARGQHCRGQQRRLPRGVHRRGRDRRAAAG